MAMLIEPLERRRLLSTTLFQPAIQYNTTQVGTLASGDVNNDGYADFVGLGNSSSQLAVFLNNGDGSFTQQPVVAAGADPRNALIFDFNNDGNLDLAFTDPGAEDAQVLLGQGDGTFILSANLPNTESHYALAEGDFNADGNADLAQDGIVYLGNGNGTFAAGINYLSADVPMSSAAIHMDGNGSTDLVTVDDTGLVSVLLNSGDGTFAAATTYSAGGSTTRSLAVADFNGDGLPDVAVVNLIASGGAGVDILLNTGNAGALLGTAQPVAAGTSPQALVAADYDGDGKVDLAVADDSVSDPAVVTLLNVGDGTFTLGGRDSVGSGPRAIATGDFNSDGKPDVVTGNLTNTASLLLSGSIAPHSLVATFGAGGPKSATVTDSNQTTMAFTLKGNGSGQVFADGQSFDVALDGTDAHSTLTVVGKHGIGFLKSLVVNGSLKSLTSKTVGYIGTFSVSGTLASLTAVGISDATMTIGGLGVPTKMVFGGVADTSLTTNSPIKSLVTSRWGDTDSTRDVITAPWIGTVTAKATPNVVPDFDADLILSDASRPKTLGTLTVAGTLDGSIIQSAGNIGTIKLGAMHQSTIFAGVSNAVSPVPLTATDFILPASIGTVIVKTASDGTGTVTGFQDSNIAAATIGKITLADVTAQTPSSPASAVVALSIKSYARIGGASGPVRKSKVSLPGVFDTDGLLFSATIVA